MDILEVERDIKSQFLETRYLTEKFTKKLRTEDYIPQPVEYVSPAKWHLGHTTWFFEEFILKQFFDQYKEFDLQFSFLFNSYYKSLGTMVFRADRGNITRPGIDEVYAYRAHVTEHILKLLEDNDTTQELAQLIELGINHEQQHQELLHTDVKLVLGTNPTFPVYDKEYDLVNKSSTGGSWIEMDEGIHEVGFKGKGFCYDNELGSHKTYISKFQIRDQLVSNKEYLEFIKDGGYQKFELWLDEGWNWCQENKITSPKYWHLITDKWYEYTFSGLKEIDLNSILCHVSFYEADAFARWKGLRLPTEFEWEVAADRLNWGKRWEWTNSSYLPYPGFSIAPGAIGEYNGKFMVNQMVLRGASVATSPGHSRKTYRNFFHPHYQWQFTGIRLAK